MAIVQSFKDVMGPYSDIPGPEISTGSKVRGNLTKQAFFRRLAS